MHCLCPVGRPAYHTCRVPTAFRAADVGTGLGGVSVGLLLGFFPSGECLALEGVSRLYGHTSVYVVEMLDLMLVACRPPNSKLADSRH